IVGVAEVNCIAYFNTKNYMSLPQNQLTVRGQTPVSLHAFSGSDKFSWTAELRHFLSRKFLKVLWWPLFRSQQRWFTHSPLMISCRQMPAFDKLWSTIQKGAFAYNNLFLKLSPFHRHSTDL